jgi:hypothetical protein
MRIQNEEQLLSIEVRKRIIDEILAPENQGRKDRAYRRYRIFKDMTKEFVISELEKQFAPKTVDEMSFSISNISLVRKIVEKLSRVYSGGTSREIVGDETQTEQLEQLADELCINQSMKKANRLLKLHKNILVMPKPCPSVAQDGSKSYDLKIDVLSPYLYDIVEDYYDREKPLAVILSNYNRSDAVRYAPNPGRRDRLGAVPGTVGGYSDNEDSSIADDPKDAENQPKDSYVFWSSRYHFTCNKSGVIISGPEITNPINLLPAVSISTEQDGQYWAQGGDDLIDASVLVNSMITHLNYIGVLQGYGQFYMTGKSLPANIIVGPNKVIKLEYEEGEPKPELGYAQANPMLSELMKAVEMHVALTLTTNNLTTSGVSMQLSGSNSFASGIAMMIDKSESMEDVKDQEQIFQDAEYDIWERIGAWMDVYGSKKLLDPSLQEIAFPKDLDLLTVKFHGQQPIMSEAEKLDNLKKRKDLGISTMSDLMLIDNPDLSKDEAQAKLTEIGKERMLRAAASVVQTGPKEVPNGETSMANEGQTGVKEEAETKEKVIQ